jgi:hypothetical protein
MPTLLLLLLLPTLLLLLLHRPAATAAITAVIFIIIITHLRPEQHFWIYDVLVKTMTACPSQGCLLMTVCPSQDYLSRSRLLSKARLLVQFPSQGCLSGATLSEVRLLVNGCLSE